MVDRDLATGIAIWLATAYIVGLAVSTMIIGTIGGATNSLLLDQLPYFMISPFGIAISIGIGLFIAAKLPLLNMTIQHSPSTPAEDDMGAYQ